MRKSVPQKDGGAVWIAANVPESGFVRRAEKITIAFSRTFRYNRERSIPSAGGEPCPAGRRTMSLGQESVRYII